MVSIFLSQACKNYSFWDLPCCACDSCLRWRIAFCSRRSNSYIAVVCCQKCNKKQFLKKGRSDQDDIYREYRLLKDLNGGFQMQSGHIFLLPNAYHYSDTYNAFSREFLEGDSILDRILHSRTRQTLEECLSTSAVWLKGLHEAPIRHYCRPGSDYRTLLTQLELYYGKLGNADPIMSLALKMMQSLLRKIDNIPVKNVPIHGDFKASNLVITPTGQVYGVDLSPQFINSESMDIAQFFVNLLLERHKIKLQKKSSDIDILILIDFFLDVYNGNSSQWNKIPVKWWMLYFTMSHWLTELKSYKPRLLVNYRFRDTLRDVMAYGNNDLIEHR